MLLKRKGVQVWARRLHIYISMALLLVTLFFAVTGLTLNRPELFERSEPARSQQLLTIPVQLLFAEAGSFQPNQAALLAFLKQQAGLRGTPSKLDIYSEVNNGKLLVGEISMNFKGPAYNASVFIDMTTGETEIDETDDGLVALLNDLHKGRNTGQVWKWFLDASALLMVLFVLTGVCLLVPKKKTFKRALHWTIAGSLLALGIYFIAVP